MSLLNMNKTALFAIVAVNVLLWSQTLTNGFVYDDNTILLGNPWVKDPGLIREVFASSMMAFDPANAPANTYRPMLYAVFMGVNALFGLSPFWFHLLNVSLHIANAVMVFLLASCLLGNGASGRGVLSVLFGALSFSVHTINAEVVNWVSASAELFFTLCVLSALYIHLRWAGAWISFAAALLFFVGLLFKETAAAFLPLAVLCDLALRKPVLRNWKAYVPYIVAVAVYALMRFNAIGGVMHHKQISLSFFETVINIFPLIAAYFSKLVLPIGLSAIYEFHAARSALDLRVVAGVVVVLAFLVALFLSRRRPALFIGLSMMAVPLLPVLYVPALSSSAMADRYLYLPSAGLAIVLAYLLPRSGSRASKASIALAAALLVAWGAGSVARSKVWKSDYTLWADAVKKAPYTPNAHYNYAWASQNAGNTRDAVEHYRRAASLAPRADAYYNLGLIYMGLSMIDEAASEFRRALSVDPSFDQARVKLIEIQRLKDSGA